METLILGMLDIQAIKFGQFMLKSGLTSPIYLDLRVIVGYPDMMKSISEKMYAVMAKDVDQLCGVPYTAFPLACCISINHNIPSVIRRKEAKSYGTKKLIEGVFSRGMKCCIIEDVITTGSSVLETAKELQGVGLIVTEAVILVDRGQGGRESIEEAGIAVKSLFNLGEILEVLLKLEKVTESQYRECIDFLAHSQVAPQPPPMPVNGIDWKARSAVAENVVAQRLMATIARKQSRLCVAADVRSMAELLALCYEVAPFISVLKVHADRIDDFCVQKMLEIKKMSVEKDFLLMADRKLADIGSTVRGQLKCSIFDYLSWADLITVHAISGDGALEAISTAGHGVIGCILVVDMSSVGGPEDPHGDYHAHCARLALRHRHAVAGFVLQAPIDCAEARADPCWPGFLNCTPGVAIDPPASGDGLGQRYRSAAQLKSAGFVDLFIVGRAVVDAARPAEEAARYRRETF